MPVTLRDSKSTIATDPLRNFKFLVRISGASPINGVSYADMGFSSVAGLNLTTEPIAYRQGGYNTTMQKLPGQSDFSPITLQRGVILHTYQSWYWMKEIFYVQFGGAPGQIPHGNNFRRTLEISVLEHPRVAQGHLEKLRIKVYNAWPVALSYSDLDAGGNQVLMEQMTLVHEGWDMTWGGPRAGEEAPAPRY